MKEEKITRVVIETLIELENCEDYYIDTVKAHGFDRIKKLLVGGETE